MIGVIAALVLASAALTGGTLLHKVGRKPVIIGSAVAAGAWSLVLLPLLDQGSALALGVGITVTLSIFGVVFGPVGAHLPELFETRFCYTGTGTGYTVGGVLGGAVPALSACVARQACWAARRSLRSSGGRAKISDSSAEWTALASG